MRWRRLKLSPQHDKIGACSRFSSNPLSLSQANFIGINQMKVTLDREGKNVVLMGLELESEKALQAYEKACRNLSKQVNIPGFRKGKAPRNIIEKSLGVDYIKREALEILVPELLGRVIRDENLDV